MKWIHLFNLQFVYASYWSMESFKPNKAGVFAPLPPLPPPPNRFRVKGLGNDYIYNSYIASTLLPWCLAWEVVTLAYQNVTLIKEVFMVRIFWLCLQIVEDDGFSSLIFTEPSYRERIVTLKIPFKMY